MTYTARLKKTPDMFRRLTGITPEKFDEILRQLQPRYETWNANRLGRPRRKREIGGGRKFSLELEDRLLLLLLYYRTYATYAFLAFLFAAFMQAVRADCSSRWSRCWPASSGFPNAGS